MAEKKEAAEVFVLPEGRLINHSLFVMDQYNDQAGPSYKAEVAYEKGALDKLFNKCLDVAIETWGEGADENVVIPIKDGDEMAVDREALNKPGEAYKGKDIVRCHTVFNKNGERDVGGIQVLNMDGETEIGPVQRSEVYNGCHVILAITIGTYKDNTGKNAVTFYLQAAQKSGEGERLISAKDHSNLFKAIGRKPAAEGEAAEPASGRSRRKG